MSLTREQKRDLNQLSEYFKKVEKLSIENSIDLDVFMTEYNRNGFSIYATERIGINTNAANRKKEFEKTSKEKLKSHANNR